MATNPPSDPHTQHQRVVIDLPAWKLITTAALIITTLGGFGAVFIRLSLSSLEANLRGAISTSVAPLSERTVMFKMILADVINNKDLSPEMRKFYTDALSKMSLGEVKSSFEPPNSKKQSLDALEASHEVTRAGRIDGLKWNGDHGAQIRFFSTNDPKLDLRKIDLVSDPPNPCSSRVIRLPGVEDAVVQVCEAHLNNRLEVIVIRKPQGTTF